MPLLSSAELLQLLQAARRCAEEFLDRVREVGLARQKVLRPIGRMFEAPAAVVADHDRLSKISDGPTVPALQTIYDAASSLTRKSEEEQPEELIEPEIEEPFEEEPEADDDEEEDEGNDEEEE